MVLYTCKKCKVGFPRKPDYTAHLNRKTDCVLNDARKKSKVVKEHQCCCGRKTNRLDCHKKHLLTCRQHLSSLEPPLKANSPIVLKSELVAKPPIKVKPLIEAKLPKPDEKVIQYPSKGTAGVYAFVSPGEKIKGTTLYKFGQSSDIRRRFYTHNCALGYDAVPLLIVKTKHHVLLEKMAKIELAKYQYIKNREVYNIDLEKLKLIVNKCNDTINRKLLIEEMLAEL